MADRRSFRLDLVACGLLLCGLVVALCIFSHSPADAPRTGVYPPSDQPANLVGPPGAWLAEGLHQSLGIAVYVLLASWFVLVVLLLVRRSLLTWSLRLSGWLLLLPCATVAADYLGPDFLDGPLQAAAAAWGPG
jgi:hypothetical protein